MPTSLPTGLSTLILRSPEASLPITTNLGRITTIVIDCTLAFSASQPQGTVVCKARGRVAGTAAVAIQRLQCSVQSDLANLTPSILELETDSGEIGYTATGVDCGGLEIDTTTGIQELRLLMSVASVTFSMKVSKSEITTGKISTIYLVPQVPVLQVDFDSSFLSSEVYELDLCPFYVMFTTDCKVEVNQQISYPVVIKEGNLGSLSTNISNTFVVCDPGTLSCSGAPFNGEIVIPETNNFVDVILYYYSDQPAQIKAAPIGGRRFMIIGSGSKVTMDLTGGDPLLQVYLDNVHLTLVADTSSHSLALLSMTNDASVNIDESQSVDIASGIWEFASYTASSLDLINVETLRLRFDLAQPISTITLGKDEVSFVAKTSFTITNRLFANLLVFDMSQLDAYSIVTVDAEVEPDYTVHFTGPIEIDFDCTVDFKTAITNALTTTCFAVNAPPSATSTGNVILVRDVQKYCFGDQFNCLARYGTRDGTISPGGKYFINLARSSNTLPELFENEIYVRPIAMTNRNCILASSDDLGNTSIYAHMVDIVIQGSVSNTTIDIHSSSTLSLDSAMSNCNVVGVTTDITGLSQIGHSNITLVGGVVSDVQFHKDAWTINSQLIGHDNNLVIQNSPLRFLAFADSSKMIRVECSQNTTYTFDRGWSSFNPAFEIPIMIVPTNSYVTVNIECALYPNYTFVGHRSHLFENFAADTTALYCVFQVNDIDAQTRCPALSTPVTYLSDLSGLDCYDAWSSPRGTYYFVSSRDAVPVIPIRLLNKREIVFAGLSVDEKMPRVHVNASEDARPTMVLSLYNVNMSFNANMRFQTNAIQLFNSVIWPANSITSVIVTYLIASVDSLRHPAWQRFQLTGLVVYCFDGLDDISIRQMEYRLSEADKPDVYIRQLFTPTIVTNQCDRALLISNADALLEYTGVEIELISDAHVTIDPYFKLANVAITAGTHVVLKSTSFNVVYANDFGQFPAFDFWKNEFGNINFVPDEPIDPPEETSTAPHESPTVSESSDETTEIVTIVYETTFLESGETTTIGHETETGHTTDTGSETAVGPETTSTTTLPNENSQDDGSISIGAIAGIVIGSVVFLALAGVLVLVLILRHKEMYPDESESDPADFSFTDFPL